MSLTPGTRLGPYEIVSPLGAGGMGEVHRARDARLGRDVAVKVLAGAFAQDEDRLRRFEDEARAAGSLNHPNLLTIFDVGTYDGSPYLVSELLEGTTLRSTLESEVLPLRKAVDYAVQIARGLAAAHEKGIVHRDLKPENLFVTKDGRAKILDFGLAKLTRPSESRAEDTGTPTTASLTSPGTVMGTVGYMSPEQVQGFPSDQRSDIFSFGAVLFEMLGAKRAFKGVTAVETMNAILKEDPPELADAARPVPSALERLARRCLEKKPQERFHSAHDLALALEALSGPWASGPADPPLVGPPLRRRAVAALLALGLLALPGLGFWLGKARGEKPVPSFQRLTSRRGRVTSARMTSDGRTVIYGAEWEGHSVQLFSTRIEGRESSALDLPGANIASVSSAGEMAILHPEEPGHTRHGLLARVQLAGGAPRDVMQRVIAADWSPDGKQLAVARITGGKVRLEFPIGRILYETEWIESIRVSPRGERIAIVTGGNRTDDNVTVFDPEGRKTVLSSGWFGELAWSPDGTEVWFTATTQGGRGLHAVSLSGRERVVMRLPALAHLYDIARDGRVLMAIGTERSEIFGRAPGESRERNLSWHESSVARGLSADGKLLLFSDSDGVVDDASLYVRKTDGSPAVRIGEGWPSLISPDAKWVAALPVKPPLDRLSLFPTGPGETRVLSGEGIEYEVLTAWAPDGKQLFLLAHEQGHEARTFVQDVAGGRPRPVTPAGMRCEGLSPDGTTLICRDTQGSGVFFQVAGHETRPIVGLEPDDEVPRWCDGGRALCVVRREDRVHKVFRLDPITGRRTAWREYRPADPAGVIGYMGIVETLDGRSYAYSYGRELNDLYVVDGLR